MTVNCVNTVYFHRVISSLRAVAERLAPTVRGKKVVSSRGSAVRNREILKYKTHRFDPGLIFGRDIYVWAPDLAAVWTKYEGNQRWIRAATTPTMSSLWSEWWMTLLPPDTTDVNLSWPSRKWKLSKKCHKNVFVYAITIIYLLSDKARFSDTKLSVVIFNNLYQLSLLHWNRP